MAKTILLADDDSDFRRLVRDFLAQRIDWEVCAEASNGVEAVDLARATCPDIAILDISMPRMNGIEAGRRIIRACPNTSVLTLSVYEPDLFISDIVRADIHGFVSKMSIVFELIPAIEAILMGETWFRLSKVRARVSGEG
jgi:DNA-binding NarL/FixJ family response regulator